jgi:hypothetical protein
MYRFILSGLLGWGLVVSFTLQCTGQIPAALTDKIRKGSGTIDMLIDVSGADLGQYLQSGTMHLGVDLNETASGNESSNSVGIAIQQLELVINTTNGEFSFSEFFTNTTASIETEGNPGGSEFFTLFGTAGSNQINGSNSNFDISSYDDVIELQNIEFDGEILGAELRVTFVDTVGNGENETFFDFSGGFEDFAIFSAEDAALLDAENIGLADSPSGIQFTTSNGNDESGGAPSPGWLVLGVLPLFFLAKQRFNASRI